MAVVPYLTLTDFKARTVIPPEDVDRLCRIRFDRSLPDTTASVSTPETAFGSVVVTGTVQYIVLSVKAPVTADPANYATFTVSKRTTGGAAVVIGSLSTSATSLPAGVPISVPVSASAITAGDVLTISVTKSGTGVTIPGFTLDVWPSPTFVDFAILRQQGYIDARLRKRYSIPLNQNSNVVPECALRWLTALVTRDCYGRKGFNPGSEQDKELVLGMADKAEVELKEAADAKDGLFDLPLSEGANPDQSGVSQGFVRGYSTQSPYVPFDEQAQVAALEDSWGHGSS